jgi:hypothetical protein
LGVLIYDPLQLLKRPFAKPEGPAGGERARRYHENSVRNRKIAEMDELLDKVARGGIESLSRSQRKQLEQLSKELYARTGAADSSPGTSDK